VKRRNAKALQPIAEASRSGARRHRHRPSGAWAALTEEATGAFAYYGIAVVLALDRVFATYSGERTVSSHCLLVLFQQDGPQAPSSTSVAKFGLPPGRRPGGGKPLHSGWGGKARPSAWFFAAPQAVFLRAQRDRLSTPAPDEEGLACPQAPPGGCGTRATTAFVGVDEHVAPTWHGRAHARAHDSSWRFPPRTRDGPSTRSGYSQEEATCDPTDPLDSAPLRRLDHPAVTPRAVAPGPGAGAARRRDLRATLSASPRSDRDRTDVLLTSAYTPVCDGGPRGLRRRDPRPPAVRGPASRPIRTVVPPPSFVYGHG